MNTWKENYYKIIFGALSEKDNIIYKVSEADNTVKFIESLLKEQREVCANIYDRAVTDAVLKPTAMTFLYTKIKNAPEPSGVKEKQ